MVSYWRPSFEKEYKDRIQEFLDDHSEIPFKDPRSFMQFCVDRTIMDIVTNEKQIEKERERIKDELQDTFDSV